VKKLYRHQIEALEWLKDRPKSILAADQGLGKTIIAARTIKKGERVLVICPATLKINWKRERLLWSDEKNIKIVNKKKDILPKEKCTIIINYDILGSREKVAGTGKKKKKGKIKPNFDFTNFDRVIIDESQMIKNSKAVRTKIAAKLIKTIDNVVLLSGTPMERPIDLYVPMYAIDAINMSYDSFGMRFCDPKKVFIGIREFMLYRGMSNADELREILKPFMLRLLKKDVMDLPERNVEIVSLDLPVGKREKEYSFSAIAKDPRPLGFEGLSELLHEQGLRKLPLAVSHIKMRLESEKKVFVVARHSDVIDILMDKLDKFNPVKLDGRCTAVEKQKSVDTFQNDENCRVFIGQIVASRVGITLTAARHVIIVESDWSYSNLMQVIDRVHRIGQKNNVNAEILTIDNSIDERMLYTTLEKESFINEIIEER